MAKILLVDDESNIIKTLTAILQDENHDVSSCKSGNEALEFIKENEVDLIILDVWLPDIDGLEVLTRIKDLHPDIAVIMISGHASIDIAVKSTKIGALDFLEKPPSMQRVITSVKNALERASLIKENIRLRREILFEDEMIGESDTILEVKKIIETAAGTNARVFITGDNGTGKELVAKAIYKNSKRSSKPLVKVNCAAIPDELIESELFGHEKGSFTGAVNRRLGKFEVADGGTLFLDEICDMSANAQAKVLRVLQEQQFERVGGNDSITVDVRTIAATNIDVKKAIDDNRFREDLYYRLNVIPIHVPSLFERKDDIPILIKHFLNFFSEQHGLGTKEISDRGIKYMMNYKWPGNVRELKNITERLCIMVQSDTIDTDDIKKHLQSYDYDDILSGNISPLKKARDDFERKYIIKALQKRNKNITSTANELGIERTNLHRKIKQYNINIDDI